MKSQDTADGMLLEAFCSRNDQDAFAALLHRHGGMVLTAARSVLGETGAAEDVLQATFLTLARKARSLDRKRSLAGWLHYVAVCLARDQRRNELRFKGREKVAAMVAARQKPVEVLSEANRAVLHEEIGMLSEIYRAPLVLYHFEGKRYEEGAAELACTAKTFSARLSRARARLRSRLARRGLAIGSVALTGMLTGSVSAAEVPAALVASTCQAACQVASVGMAAADGMVSANALSLAQGGVRMLFWNKVKMTTAACVATCAIVLAPAGWGIICAGEEGPSAAIGSEETPVEKAPPVAAKPAAAAGRIVGDVSALMAANEAGLITEEQLRKAVRAAGGKKGNTVSLKDGLGLTTLTGIRVVLSSSSDRKSHGTTDQETLKSVGKMIGDLPYGGDMRVSFGLREEWTVELTDKEGTRAFLSIFNDRLRSPETTFYAQPEIEKIADELARRLKSIANTTEETEAF